MPTTSTTQVLATIAAMAILALDSPAFGAETLDAPAATMQIFPAQEGALLANVNQFTAVYGQAANEMAQGGIRIQRARQICAIFGTALSDDLSQPGISVHGWLGIIEKIGSNNDGKGILTLRLNRHVTVSTWNNAFSDFMDKTLIEPGTSVFTLASTLKVGDRVRFGGEFARSGKDCLHESSMVWTNSMADPEFIFRFSELSAF